MTDDELRRAYLRVADPFGTRARIVFLPLSLAGIGIYALLGDVGELRPVLLVLVLGFAGFYGVVSWWTCRTAARESPAVLRERFVSKARAAVASLPTLLFRCVLWTGVGIYGAWRLRSGSRAPLDVFLAAAGGVFALRFLGDLVLDLPRVRRDLREVEGEPVP